MYNVLLVVRPARQGAAPGLGAPDVPHQTSGVRSRHGTSSAACSRRTTRCPPPSSSPAVPRPAPRRRRCRAFDVPDRGRRRSSRGTGDVPHASLAVSLPEPRRRRDLPVLKAQHRRPAELLAQCRQVRNRVAGKAAWLPVPHAVFELVAGKRGEQYLAGARVGSGKACVLLLDRRLPLVGRDPAESRPGSRRPRAEALNRG